MAGFEFAHRQAELDGAQACCPKHFLWGGGSPLRKGLQQEISGQANALQARLPDFNNLVYFIMYYNCRNALCTKYPEIHCEALL